MEVQFMKNIAKLLLLSIVLSLCLSLVSCSGITPSWSRGNTAFWVTIENASGFDTLDFEITSEHYFNVKLFGEDATKETYKDIKIECNNENAVVSYAYTNTGSDTVKFKIYFYELGTADELKITYKGKTISVNYNVTDYDFEAHGFIVPDSLDYFDKYPEFKEMLLSVTRHEYAEPYIGIDDKEFSTIKDKPYGEKKIYDLYSGEDSENPGYVSTDYLPYLKDSIYYPAKFDTVKENPISTIDVSMGLFPDTDTSAGSGRAVMSSFGISFHLIDPGHTHPQYPLSSMYFYASLKQRAMNYTTDGTDSYPSARAIMLEKYPEHFFIYEHNGLTMYILCSKTNGAIAYFTDDTYAYYFNTAYNND